MNVFEKFYYEYLSCLSTAVKTVRRNLKGTKFEPDVAVLNNFIKQGDVVIDVGGAYGRYAYPISRLVGPKGRVYSFEPGTYSSRVLKFVAWFHGLKNVVVIKQALSDKEGSINLCFPVKKTGKVGPSLAYISTENASHAWTEKVPMVTIDDYCRRSRIESIRFIKCDVEGAELNVYRGADAMIRKCRPVVLSEVDADNLKRFGYDVNDLEKFFLERGYKIAYLKDGVITPTEHITFSGNFYFIPT